MGQGKRDKIKRMEKNGGKRGYQAVNLREMDRSILIMLKKRGC